MRIPLTVVLVLMCLTACGGGGASSSQNNAPVVDPPPAEPPFGLTSREPVAALSIPLGGGALGTYALDESFPNLDFPAAVFLAAVPGENRLVVVEQSGFVRVFVDDAAATATTVVLDLSGRVIFGGEQGLLGLAFDPGFQSNRYFYVHYVLSVSGQRTSRIARFTWDRGTGTAALASEKIILEVEQPYSNHNAGMLAFGPDDHLYIAFGDGGSGGDPDNHAQSPSDLLGTVLRIDVHPVDPADPYEIPADNPFLGRAGFLPEIYAYGLRNPWRFSFDRATGTLWLGDVGQNAREEIDVIEAGGNYGWRIYEGNLEFDNPQNLPPSDFSAPVIDYDRSLGNVVIGGYVYRGSRVPSLQGRYLYGDNGSGNIWALDYDAATGTVMANDLIASRGGITSFGEDTTADVHVVTGGGAIFRFRETSAGAPSDPPPLLSQTGVFDDLHSLTVAGGFIEYDLNQPFWSDGTVKRRWIAVPDGRTVSFTAVGAWQFPVGTVVVKHFELALTEGDPSSQRRLETRLLAHRNDGWRGFTYRWNAAGTDAQLLTGREQEVLTVALAGGGSRDQLYEYPSRTDCLACHTDVQGVVLGLRTRQLNRDFAYPAATDNQLRSWSHIGLFSTDIGAAGSHEAFPILDDGGAPLDVRARAYLDINCAQCHQPGGTAPTAMDLRFDTSLGSTNTVNVSPSAGDLGVTGARIVTPGDRGASVLWLRMQTLDGERMPPLGSHAVDATGSQVIGDWIDGL